MANTARSAPRKTYAKRPTSKAKHRSNTQQSPVASEIKHLIAAALGILLMLAMYISNAAGVVGTFIRTVLVSLFGFGAYLLPLVVVALPLYALFSGARKISTRICAEAAIFFWCLLALVHLSVSRDILDYPHVAAYLNALYEQGGATNGGLFGGLLANLLRGLLDTAGAYIVLITGGLIILMLLTGRTFSALIPRFAAYLRDRFARGDDRYYEEDEIEEEAPESEPSRPIEKSRPKPSRGGTNLKAAPRMFDIDEKQERETNRVLLINEEIAHAKPRSIKRPSKPTPAYSPIIDIETRRPVGALAPAFSAESAAPVAEAEIEMDPADLDAFSDFEAEPERLETSERPETAVLPSDITVKGLVGGAHVKSGGTDALGSGLGLDWDEPPFDTDTPQTPAVSARRPQPTVRVPMAIPPSDARPYEDYELPPIHLLTKNTNVNPTGSRTQILENSRILEETLRSFRVEAKVVEVSVGPTVTRYDLAPGPGVKVAAIANLSNDLALSLAAQGIRIEAPIPGKAAVGIEIPNKEPQPVLLREIIEDDSFQKFASRLAFAVGKDIAGNPVVTDVARMPHLLIAGATGSGKSVCINTLITSLLYKSRPDEVKLLMVDPKVVELSVYNGIPHLLIPVVTDPKKASGALQWAVAEMEKRYGLFAGAGVRDLRGYNTYLTDADEEDAALPQIVIIIDELADLMMTCKGEVEESICRLAQKARAAGIHLIVATQRPSVDVITGLIKANIPSRLAFAVSSGIDSRTVLDMYGAEKLLGKGDMLFLPSGQAKPIRLQGGFISDKEVESVVDFLKEQNYTEIPDEMVEQVTAPARGAAAGDEDQDEYFNEAVEFLIEKGKASTTLLQKRFRIGYNRASRLMDDLEARGVVGPEDGVKPRKILITYEEYITEFGG